MGICWLMRLEDVLFLCVEIVNALAVSPQICYAITSEVTKNSVQNWNSIDLRKEIDAVQTEIIAEETNGRDLLC